MADRPSRRPPGMATEKLDLDLEHEAAMQALEHEAERAREVRERARQLAQRVAARRSGEHRLDLPGALKPGV